jgi:quinol monooxygenase YgiN
MANHEITYLIECEARPGRSSDFEALIPVLEAAANDDPGTVEYRWYAGSRPNEWCLLERYLDSDASLAHIEAFGKELTERYLELVAVKSVIMLGSASDQLTAVLKPFFDGSVPRVTSARYGAADAPRADEVSGTTK